MDGVASGHRQPHSVCVDDIKFYPQQVYSTNTGDFAHIKKLVATVPPPKPQPGKLILAKQGGSPTNQPSIGMKDYTANGFTIGYPDTWQAGQAEPGSSLYLIPQGGVAKDQSGGVELLSGAMIDYYVPQTGAASHESRQQHEGVPRHAAQRRYQSESRHAATGSARWQSRVDAHE